MNVFRTQKKGFTLIEMLVVIAIIALLASILVPAVNNALKTANRMKVMANGRSIYATIFATVTTSGTIRRSSSSSYFAEEGSSDYSNSTEYFAWLMRAKDDSNGAGEILPVDFAMFAGPKVNPPENLADFDGENNIWSVVTGLSADDASNMPYLITRNLNEDKLVDWGDDVDSRPTSVGDAPYEDPYGEDAVVVVRIGGGGDVIVKKDLYWEVINPGAKDSSGSRPDNDILQPE